MPLNRRELLLNSWKVGGLMLGAAAVWTAYESLRPLAAEGAGGPFKAGAASRFGDGTATYFREARLYISNAGGTYFALSQKCPHLGCKVPFCQSSGRFECPCHGSIYDLAGEYIAGPAPRGMDRYGLSLDGDQLVVDTTDFITGPPRGTQDHLTPARGPSCVEGA